MRLSSSCCIYAMVVAAVIIQLSLVLKLSTAESNSILFQIQRESASLNRIYSFKTAKFYAIRGGNDENHVEQAEVDTKIVDQNSKDEDGTKGDEIHKSIDLDETATTNTNDNQMVQIEESGDPPVEMMIESSTDMLSLQSKASSLRCDGKLLHDDGKFVQAANIFSEAAKLLDGAIGMSNDQKIRNEIAEERATCRLHEALCYLKEKDFTKAFTSCTDVLQDGLQIFEVENHRELLEDGLISEDDSATQYIIRINQTSENELNDEMVQLTPAVRARAFHRRAKARLALDDTTGALEDAKSAAFLGDRNAVALYGKLMRESGSHQSVFGDDGGGAFSDLLSSYMGNPFESSSGSRNLPFGSGTDSGFGLLGSLMNGSASSSDRSHNGLESMLNGDRDLGGLAKSILTSVSKRIEEKSTQESICNYLNAVDAAQVISLSNMVGFPMSESSANRLVSFVNQLTPQGINKSIKIIKRVLMVGALIRKVVNVIRKYKHVIILLLLLQWCKSAIYRPIVVKVSKNSAATATEAALLNLI